MTATGEAEQSEVIDPAALTTAFEAQRLNTLRQVDQAREGMAHVKATLEQLAARPETTEAADTAWNNLKPVRRVLKQIDAVMAGAAQVITTVIDQRDTVATELKELTGAIKVQDTDHPALKPLAERLYRDGYVTGFSQGEDATGMEYGGYGEIVDWGETDHEERLAVRIADQWSVSGEAATNFLWAIQGQGAMTTEQHEAFQALLSTF